MIKKIILSLLVFCPLLLDSAHAINVSTTNASAWGVSSGMQAQSTYGDFILAGGLGKSGRHGTTRDEWGLVGMIANQIVEHGGYFCPYQLQCQNNKNRELSWTTYYRPIGFSADKCAWLCESGYSGTNCMPVADGAVAYCDSSSHAKSGNGKYAGLSMKTSGGWSGMVESEIVGFAQWGQDPECDVILGIIKFMEHGVVAAPIQACCGRDNWKDNDSFVNTLGIAGNQKVLCAPGYKPNATNSDCEPIDALFCDNPNIQFCENFPRAGYNSTIHTIKQEGDCVKYFCSEPGKAFPATGQTTCEDCATSVKGGAHPDDGVCVKCATGQFFDSDAGTCESATAYTASELMYGEGKSKNTNSEVANQCWPLVAPKEYMECVKNGGKSQTQSQSRSQAQPAGNDPEISNGNWMINRSRLN